VRRPTIAAAPGTAPTGSSSPTAKLDKVLGVPDTALDASIAAAVDVIRDKVEAFLADGMSVVASSSFQTHSIPMLHILASTGPVPVYFLDTGFHFPETLTYRDTIAQMLCIEVISLRSVVTKLAQSTREHGFLYTTDPDQCCYLNKTAPMEIVTRSSDVWVSGVRRDQNTNRASFDSVMAGPNGSLRYHPMLDWTSEMIDRYIADHGIPAHPLDAEGYASIGCAPCTRRVAGDGREGRWAGMQKTECGLHLDLVAR
jgi:phosphoadenosine phosphosulfate reductase